MTTKNLHNPLNIPYFCFFILKLILNGIGLSQRFKQSTAGGRSFN
jgi:hypothetical protein